MQPGQYSQELIQNPQDIENFDELDDQNAYVYQDESIPPLPQDLKLLQIKNNLGTIAENLHMFSDLVRTMNTQFQSKPIQVNSRERAMNELNKAYTCKLKCLGEIKKKHQLQDYLNTKKEEQNKIEASLQKISKQFAFASSLQLINFARAFKVPFDNGNFIYANLYHDKLSGDFPCLKLTKKNNELELVRDPSHLKGEKYFVIDVQGPNKRWISIPQNQNSIYEKMIYDYIERNKEKKRDILNYTIEFKYIEENSPDFLDIQKAISQNIDIYQNLLFAKLLHELIVKPNGSLDTYFQFVKHFILEQENQEITDQQRYHNILSHLKYPEQIYGVGK